MVERVGPGEPVSAPRVASDELRPAPGSPSATNARSESPIRRGDDTNVVGPAAPPAAPAGKPRRRKVRQVFIVSLARSGSTLLRYLLDSHPDVTSPPELNLSALLQHVVEVWSRTNEALDTGSEVDDPNTVLLSPDVRRHARKVVDEIMVHCANVAGASVYCDKSLTTVEHLATVSQCYPEADYIFLYRYPLDMIASGIEASRWGFNAYGFAPYVGTTPGNFVAGLGNYWIDKVSRMVEFERTCEVSHARIYYELLCDEPATTLSDLLGFLGLPADEAILQRAFESDHGAGPGDYKIDFTDAINPDSIGRGASLPQRLAPEQVARINSLLADLDYPALDSGWRGDLGALLGLKRVEDGRPESRKIAESLVTLLADRVGTVLADGQHHELPVELVVRTGRGEDAWVSIDKTGTVTIGNGRRDPSGPPLPRVRSIDDVLLRVAAGEVNLAQAIHDGRVRVERDETTEGAPIARPRQLLATLGALLRSDPGEAASR